LPASSDATTLLLLAESFRSSGFGRIDLRGESMMPTLRDGWTVLVRPIPPESLRVGEIAVFINRGVLTIHRLIWKKLRDDREQFIFQGDNSAAREMVEANAILGVVDSAEMARGDAGVRIPVPVGKDHRALFYRTAYRLHTLAASLMPGLRLPVEESRGGFGYRALRRCFLFLEKAFSPHPHRRDKGPDSPFDPPI